jgi:hypothetical protein
MGNGPKLEIPNPGLNYVLFRSWSLYIKLQSFAVAASAFCDWTVIPGTDHLPRPVRTLPFSSRACADAQYLLEFDVIPPFYVVFAIIFGGICTHDP